MHLRPTSCVLRCCISFVGASLYTMHRMRRHRVQQCGAGFLEGSFVHGTLLGPVICLNFTAEQ